MQKKYKFDAWHIKPYELKDYAVAVAKYVNSNGQIKKEVIDVGCGLGELLKHIHADKRYGYDVYDEIVEAARFLNRRNNIVISKGLFRKYWK